MDTYAIVIRNHEVSESGFFNLNNSSVGVGNLFTIKRFDAVVPDMVPDLLKQLNIEWNYPTSGSVLDPWTGLRKTSYGEKDLRRRIACSLSHFLLWQKCVENDTPLLVLEHDAMFNIHFDCDGILDSKYGIVGINNPTNATFAAEHYIRLTQQQQGEIVPVPMLTSKEIPQGLAGNSAYVIKPKAAKHLIELCYIYGLWPNDAIMCQQLCDFLGVTKTYYTQVQGLKSTTSL